MTAREVLRRSATLRTIYRRARSFTLPTLRKLRYERMSGPAAVRVAYEVLLRREPDPVGFAEYLGQIRSGAMTRDEMAQMLRGSEEFQTLGFSARMLGPSIHAGRCQFIRSLPRAKRIIDLGGTHLARDVGALVSLGYPYPFDDLTIIDLPSEDRHAIYRSEDNRKTVESPLGPVTYRYHSMVDLSGYEDSSTDLIYSGQSIEHVTVDEARIALKESFRVLRPGGYIALDTPNARVTRLQQEEFIDPDHKYEYTWPELRDLIESGGLIVTAAYGLNFAGSSVSTGVFNGGEVARNWGLHHDLEDCYILAVLAQKPHT